MKQYFRNPRGMWTNVLALAYTLLGYAAGIVMLTADSWWINAVGVFLTGHAMVYAAYFVHEFSHQSVFKSGDANNRWGTLMMWPTGGCYAKFAALRHKHMRHHIDRADVLSFDYKEFLRSAPAWVRNLVLGLEWLYVPAVEFLMHGYMMLLPFLLPERKNERLRVSAIFVIRVALFALLYWISPKALLLYLVAYIFMLLMLRFGDEFQHTYDVFIIVEGGDIPDGKLRDREYEQANTFSNLASLSHPALSLLWLNFPYHNAHHERPIEPWYNLPKLHDDLFGREYDQVIPMFDLLRGHHRNRVKRVLSDDYGEVGKGPGKAERFLGAVGVSFLYTV